MVSRGSSPVDLLDNELWWKGSPHLHQPELQVIEPDEVSELQELKSTTVPATVKVDTLIRLDLKLQRPWAYVLRFIDLVVYRKRHVTSIGAVKVARAERAMFLVFQVYIVH